MTVPSNVRATARRLIPFGLLAFAEGVLFFRNPGHFFNADTLFWLWNRHHTVLEFLAGFTRLDPALWYRPLSQRSVESLLFPLAGLNPVPYRIVGFTLFFSCTVLLFRIGLRLLECRRAAWFAVLAFMPHLAHAYTTYDVAYTPDLLLLLFCLGSALSYITFLRTGDRSSLFLSVLFFIASLLSKETGAGLPAALLAIWFFVRRKSSGTPLSLIPHFLILAVYLVFVFGFLHVRSLELGHLLGWIPQERAGGYGFGVENVLRNIRETLNWIFGIPAGTNGQWVFGAPWILPMLTGLRVAACAVALVVLFTPRRRVLFLGISWFIAMLAPATLLQTHFLPYYLFAPLAGLALAGGTVLDWVYLQVGRISPRATTAIVVLVLAGWTKGQINAANRLVLSHALLGGAATVSGLALKDVQGAYPTLPRAAQLIFFNEDVPFAALAHAHGLLFKLAYDDPELVVRYYTTGLPDGLDAAGVLAFKWTDGHFVDVTSFVRQRPDLLLPHSPTANYHLELKLGGSSDNQILRIPELGNARIELLYAVDGRIREPLRAALDDAGGFPFLECFGIRTCVVVAARREGDRSWAVINRSIPAD